MGDEGQLDLNLGFLRKYCAELPKYWAVNIVHTLIKESYHDVENPDQLRVLAFSTLP